MTKQVRIENADTSDHKIEIRAQILVNGEWKDDNVFSVDLSSPTQMYLGTLWKERRLIVQEV